MNSTDRQTFIEQIAGAALKHCTDYGICVVSPIIAQACLESAYGTSEKAKHHNYFGLKYRKDRVTCNNGTFVDSSKEQNQDGSWTPITDKWYNFDTLEQGVEGYLQFINTENYANLKGVTDAYQYLELIWQDGYTPTKKYVAECFNVIVANDLTRYDLKINTERKVEMPFEYVEDFNLKPARAYSKREKTERILLHHFSGDSSIESVHKYHISRGHAGIDYNIVILKNGNAVWGRGLEMCGGSVNGALAKCKGFNSTSIAVACQGDLEHNQMPQGQKYTLFKLVKDLCEYYKLPVSKVLGHDEAAGPGYTDCPGRYFPLKELKSYLAGEISAPIPVDSTDKGSPVMPALERVLRYTSPMMRGR